MKKRRTILFLTALAVICGALGTAAWGAEKVSDPTVRLINGSTAVTTDSAVYTDEGGVALGLTASNGYGTRANFSNLGEAGLLDVKHFSTSFTMDVPVNISTVFSLQTDPAGTIGAGFGNGVQILLRKDREGILTLAIYDQAAATPYYATADAITLNAANEVTISFEVGEDAVITVSSGESTVTVPGLKTVFETHYAPHGYLGYFSLSSYYMAAVTDNKCQYVVTSINGETPLAYETGLVEGALRALETEIAGLTADSTLKEIAAAGEKNVFDEGVWKDLLAAADREGTLRFRLETALADYAAFADRVEYEKLMAALETLAGSIENYSFENELSVKAAREAYAAVDLEKIAGMGEPYGEKLREKLAEVRGREKFAAFMGDEAERFLAGYEERTAGGDADSLRTFREPEEMTSLWQAFVTRNTLGDYLTETELDSLDARAEALQKLAETSFYTTLWTEGDTWNAELREQGLYATGEGKYHETLGFNEKLELGKDSEITFNVIYALKRLGANHLHVGFYPKSGTGTLGDTDGVRVDFWFSGSSIEIKPVNGRDESPLYDAAYITVPDTGFFDPDAADYDAGRYTVRLGRQGNSLLLTVNGSEMELSGLNADLFDEGCYVTLSAMSVKGADFNEVLVTSLGGIDYIGYDPDGNQKPSDETGGCGGCGSVSGGLTAGSVLPVLALAGFLRKKFDKGNGNG